MIRRAQIIFFCLLSMTLEVVALALCDVAEALSQMGKISSDRARKILDERKK